jgi:hypothetical protein
MNNYIKMCFYLDSFSWKQYNFNNKKVDKYFEEPTN